MTDNTTTPTPESRTLTRDELAILRVIPDVALISQPIDLHSGITLYFCKTLSGRIMLQAINSDDGTTRGPIAMTPQELENDLPQVLGKFLQAMIAGKHDRVILDAAVKRRAAATRAAERPVSPDDVYDGGAM